MSENKRKTDTNFIDFELFIDSKTQEFWLVNSLRQSSGVIHGRVEAAQYHYNVGRAKDFDGYFEGNLIILDRVPFTKVAYPASHHLTNQTNQKEGNIMSTAPDATVVKEAKTSDVSSVVNDKPANTKPIATYTNKQGELVNLFHFDPKLHIDVDNPKKAHLNMSRRERNLFKTEREVYLKDLEAQTAPPAPPTAPAKEEAKKVTDKVAKEKKPDKPAIVNERPPKPVPFIRPINLTDNVNHKAFVSDATLRKIAGQIGKTAVIQTMGDLSIEEGCFLASIDGADGKFKAIQYPHENVKETVLLSFPKLSTASYFLKEMTGLPSYKRQFEGLKVYKLSEISQTAACYATVTVDNVREFIAQWQNN